MRQVEQPTSQAGSLSVMGRFLLSTFHFCSLKSNKSRYFPAAVLALLAGCDRPAPADWHGWVYPDGAALMIDVKLGRFETIEQCRASAKAVIERLDHTDENGDEIVSDYECGYKCKPDGALGGLNVCEKTEK